MKVEQTNLNKMNQQHSNHEIWVECDVCDEEYDMRSVHVCKPKVVVKDDE